MNAIFLFNKSNRPWHMPVAAGFCVGTPLFFGWYFNEIEPAKLISLAGLSFLYIQSDNLKQRMTIMMICCFGIMISYTVGLLGSVHPIVAPITLGLFSFAVHFCLYQLELTRPPGNFFFIMLASTGICSPFQPELIPEKIGFIGIGTMFTCAVALVYSLLTLRPQAHTLSIGNKKSQHSVLIEAAIIGFVLMISLAIALTLKIDNPYWIPITCIAVMQGSSSKHIRIRGAQRVIGTFIGLGITWLIVLVSPGLLVTVIAITILQMVVEFLVVKNYAIAVVFITVLTIFLSESGKDWQLESNAIFASRMTDIAIGSIVGVIGGWILYHKKIVS